MSKFYGQVQGQASSRATRQGSERSHIAASVQSWDGSVTNKLYYDADGELCIQVYHAEGSDFYGRTVFRGTVERFLAMCSREMEGVK